MRLALSLILIGAVVACADPSTAPATGGTVNRYLVIGGTSTGNPPPPPLSTSLLFLAGDTHSTSTDGTFDLNATRDGATFTANTSTTSTGSGIVAGSFAAAATAPGGLITFTPGPGGGTVTGSGILVLGLNGGTVTIDLSRNLRSGNSKLSPACVIAPRNSCALVRVEGALFAAPHASTVTINGYLEIDLAGH